MNGGGIIILIKKSSLMKERMVKYYMYNKLVPVKYQSGSVVIKCDDTGAITDNI